jgi:hypothetical protein
VYARDRLAAGFADAAALEGKAEALISLVDTTHAQVAEFDLRQSLDTAVQYGMEWSVSFSVAPSGEVSDVAVGQDTPSSKPFRKVIADNVSAWRFPRLSAEAPVRVVYGKK